MGINLQHVSKAAHDQALVRLLFVFCTLVTDGGCSHPCFSSGDLLVCRGQNLSAVPDDLSHLTRRLDLSSNAIAWLCPAHSTHALLPRGLEVLLLSGNRLRALAGGTFDGVPHLRHLDVSSNRLRWLHREAFRGLQELEELLLYDNRLGRVVPGAFHGLRNLQRLYLGRNRLKRFPLDAFSFDDVAPLTPSSTSASPFSSSSSSSVSLLSQLRVFDLSFNFLREVPEARILSLSPRAQAGIYLHGNPLVCSRALRSMLRQWACWCFHTMAAGFEVAHRCLGEAFSQNASKCSPERLKHGLPLGNSVRLGEQPCSHSKITSSRGPSTHRETSELHEKQLKPVHPNRAPEIQGLQLEDVGAHNCSKTCEEHADQAENISLTIRKVTPVATMPHSFPILFTGLLSLAASLSILLLFLFLSPHPCSQTIHFNGSRTSLYPCVPRPSIQARAAKKVVFAEPWKCFPNLEGVPTLGRRPTLETLDEAAPPNLVRGILKNGAGRTPGCPPENTNTSPGLEAVRRDTT